MPKIWLCYLTHGSSSSFLSVPSSISQWLWCFFVCKIKNANKRVYVCILYSRICKTFLLSFSRSFSIMPTSKNYFFEIFGCRSQVTSMEMCVTPSKTNINILWQMRKKEGLKVPIYDRRQLWTNLLQAFYSSLFVCNES